MPLKYILKFYTVILLFRESRKILKRIEEVFMSFIGKNVWIRDQIEIKKVTDTAYVVLGIKSLSDFNY